jgi:hypothetical protein
MSYKKARDVILKEIKDKVKEYQLITQEWLNSG